MRKAVLTLLLGSIIAVPLWKHGHTSARSIELDIPTTAGEISLSTAEGRTTVAPTGTAAGEFFNLTEPGKPALPARVINVVLPNGERFARIEASSSGTRTLARGIELALAAPRTDDAGAAFDLVAGELAPSSGGAFPSEVVRYLGGGTWHGVEIVSFAVFPLHAVDGALLLHESIHLRIVTTPDAPSHAAARPVRGSASRVREMEALMRAGALNPDALSTYPAIASVEHRGVFGTAAAPSTEGSPVDCVIVTPAALAPAFDALADWKTSKGVPTVVRTIEWIEASFPRGVDRAETIRFFLKDAYTNWGVRWVLLVGDAQEIPPRYLYSRFNYGGTSIPSDLYFACLDGSFNADGDTYFGEQPEDAPDLYPELSVGRLPVSNLADATTLVTKIMQHEGPADSSYVDKTLFLAEVLSPAPWSPPAPIYLNGADMADFVYQLHVQSPARRVTRLYETTTYFPGSLPESRAVAIDSLNAGYNYVFHVGHGYRFNMHCADDNIAIADADALYHPGRYFNLFMLNCSAAAFHYDCLAEHLLRNPNGGAVSVIGAVNNAFAEVSIPYMEAYADAVFAGADVVHLGDAYNASFASRTPLAGQDNADLWTHYIMTLLGDPEMTLWSGPALDPVVTHPTAMIAGSSAVTVGVAVAGDPVAGASVCLWKGDEDYQVATTNGSGQAWFDFSAETAGVVRVVVTGHNLTRYEGSIQVGSATDPLLSLAAVSLADSALGTLGNDNGAADAGEIVELWPTLRNTGGTAAAPVVATLSSSSPFVAVVDATASFDSVGPGTNAAPLDPWRVEIAAGAPDEAAAEFAVAIDAGATWNDAFARVLHAPEIALTSVTANDAPPVGNGDGVISSGEEFVLGLAMKNSGSGQVDGLMATLIAFNSGATVTSDAFEMGTIPAHTEMSYPAAFSLFESNVAVENPLQIVVTDSHGRTAIYPIELRKPLPPAIQSLDASLGVDKMMVKWTPSPSNDTVGYRVYRATSFGGPFTRATPDAVTHTLFTDTGLASSTRYYFAVTALDESGNESAFSPIASASTNPPMLAGWPNMLVDASANSPIVGDIDGNGDLEVVVGNNLLYAFNHDGSEVRDGDGQPVTWGVFSTLGDDFVGPAALAKLDGDMGLDIVAATLTSKQVFCFNADGTVLPGWPRPTVDMVRAGVAVGDIDGDGEPEIVAVDQDAYLYAWHVNGSEVVDGDGNPATDGVFRRLPDTPQLQYQMPALADIDQDGKEEVIIATQDKKVYVLNELAADEAGWPRTLPNFAGGGVAVGDIDANGDLEIVVTVRSTGEIYALHHDNTQMWIRWTNQNLYFNPSPALADLTGDGKLEVVLPASNGRMYAITHTGADAPGWPVIYSTSYTESSPVIADVDGDGSVDVLLGDEKTFINAWSATGVPIDGFPLVTKDSVRGTPAIADLDGDGGVEIIAVGYDRGVYVWDLPGAYNEARAPWPMFKANYHRNGVHGYTVATGVGDHPSVLPAALRLEQNYPNPFNPATSIVYEIPAGAARRVSLVVYDVSGARVRTLVDGSVLPGRYATAWDGRNLYGESVASGVYFYRLAAENQTALTRKMVLLK